MRWTANGWNGRAAAAREAGRPPASRRRGVDVGSRTNPPGALGGRAVPSRMRGRAPWRCASQDHEDDAAAAARARPSPAGWGDPDGRRSALQGSGGEPAEGGAAGGELGSADPLPHDETPAIAEGRRADAVHHTAARASAVPTAVQPPAGQPRPRDPAPARRGEVLTLELGEHRACRPTELVTTSRRLISTGRAEPVPAAPASPRRSTRGRCPDASRAGTHHLDRCGWHGCDAALE
jgi:hypothetical protein